MAERNSEGKYTVWAVVVIVIGSIGVVAAHLLSTGVLDQWPTAVAIVGVVASIAKMIGDYSKSRPEKHKAMALAADVAKSAGGADDPS